MIQSKHTQRIGPSAQASQGTRPPPAHVAHGRRPPRGRPSGVASSMIPRGPVRQQPQTQPQAQAQAQPSPTSQPVLEAALATISSSQTAVELASASTAAAEAALLVANASLDPASGSPSVSIAAQAAAHNALAAAERTARTIQHFHAQFQHQQREEAAAMSHVSARIDLTTREEPIDLTPNLGLTHIHIPHQQEARPTLLINSGAPWLIPLEAPPNTFQLLLDLASATRSINTTASHIPLPPLIPTVSTSDSPPDPTLHLGAAPNKVRIDHLSRFTHPDPLKSLVLSTSSPPLSSCTHIWICREPSTLTCAAVFYFNLYPDACQFLRHIQSLIESDSLKSLLGATRPGCEFSASLHTSVTDPRLTRLHTVRDPRQAHARGQPFVPKLAPTMTRRQKGVNLTLPVGIAQKAVHLYENKLSKEAKIKQVDLVGGDHDDDERSLSPTVDVLLSSDSEADDVEVWAVHKSRRVIEEEEMVLSLDSEEIEE